MPWPSNLALESNGGVSPDQLSELELNIGVELPQDYRNFLLETGGGYVDDLIAECIVPTPFGQLNIVEFGDLNSIVRLRSMHTGANGHEVSIRYFHGGILESEVTPRNIICIAHGHFGMTTCLSVAGIDYGSVYALDTEMRYFWDKAKLENLPNLDPSIVEFFRMRDNNALPSRPFGYENLYLVAGSFDDLLSKLASITNEQS
jgi:hypothetical protein